MSSRFIQTPVTASRALVKQSPLFASLPNSLLADMAEHFQLQEWEKNEFINPDLLLQRFCFLLEGQLEYKRVNPDTGREVSLDILYPGDSFDIVVLLDGKPRDMLISTISRVRLISLPIDMMRRWLWTYPELNKQFLPYLAQKIREYENHATNLALYDISTRLSRIILKHLNKIQTYTGDRNEAHKEHLINGFSDEALARMAGSVRQVVNKQLQYWRSQGILDKKRNQILINDLEALYQEAKQTHSSF